jgi:Tfp pilus assembly protein PilF
VAGSDAALTRAAALLESDPDEAHTILNSLLNADPDDAKTLFVMARLHISAGRFGVALHLLRRVTQLAPQRHQGWNDLGMSYSSVQRFKEARDAFLEACKRAPTDSGYVANVAMTYLEQSDYKAALRWAEKALALNPDQRGAMQTRGFASLALGDWRTGWAGYDLALGGKFRKVVRVADEPQWDGKHVDTLFVFGEQGLGDEIMMASCVPDAARDVGKLVLECDERLAGLFRRSFPQCDVYGTRRARERSWPAQYKIDAGAGIAQLPKWYRPEPSSCPGTPYLVADPERRLQWRALLDSLGRRPKIGICWSGGKRWTNSVGRAIGLEAFKPLMDALDADFISLQYGKETEAEIRASGLPVRHWPHAVSTTDYDDTAALVAELDMVVGVHTAVHHLAGALGVPATVLVPSKGLWIWEMDPMPFYSSARIFRQRTGEPWLKTMQRLVSDGTYLDRLRQPGSGGVACVRTEHHRDGISASSPQATGAQLAELVLESSGRHQSVHHQSLSAAGA